MMNAPPGGIPTTVYNDDSILQALRRLPPDDLIKHMLETEDWSQRLTAQCGASPGTAHSPDPRLRASLLPLLPL